MPLGGTGKSRGLQFEVVTRAVAGRLGRGRHSPEWFDGGEGTRTWNRAGAAAWNRGDWPSAREDEREDRDAEVGAHEEDDFEDDVTERS